MTKTAKQPGTYYVIRRAAAAARAELAPLRKVLKERFKTIKCKHCGYRVMWSNEELEGCVAVECPECGGSTELKK